MMEIKIKKYIGKTLAEYEETIQPNPYFDYTIMDYNIKGYTFESAKDFTIVDMYQKIYDNNDAESFTRIVIIVDEEGFEGYSRKIKRDLVRAQDNINEVWEELVKVRTLFKQYYWKFGELNEGDFNIIFGCKTTEVK